MGWPVFKSGTWGIPENKVRTTHQAAVQSRLTGPLVAGPVQQHHTARCCSEGQQQARRSSRCAKRRLQRHPDQQESLRFKPTNKLLYAHLSRP